MIEHNLERSKQELLDAILENLEKLDGKSVSFHPSYLEFFEIEDLETILADITSSTEDFYTTDGLSYLDEISQKCS